MAQRDDDPRLDGGRSGLAQRARKIGGGAAFWLWSDQRAAEAAQLLTQNKLLASQLSSANQALEDAPEKVNESCYGEGWLITLRVDDEAELEALLDADRYRQSVAERDT